MRGIGFFVFICWIRRWTHGITTRWLCRTKNRTVGMTEMLQVDTQNDGLTGRRKDEELDFLLMISGDQQGHRFGPSVDCGKEMAIKRLYWSGGLN